MICPYTSRHSNTTFGVKTREWLDPGVTAVADTVTRSSHCHVDYNPAAAAATAATDAATYISATTLAKTGATRMGHTAFYHMSRCHHRTHGLLPHELLLPQGT